MIDGRKVLALITARGGSKGLPGKNVLPLGGKPLVAWSVAAARGSRFIDRIVISSDDQAIIDAAMAAGAEAPFIRPAELATDTTPSEPVALHALDAIGADFDLLVLLQPTSPLRTSADIDACVSLCVGRDAPGCLSVVEPSKSPWWMMRMAADGGLSWLMDTDARAGRRQDLPKAYAPNGAVYVIRIDWFRRNRAFFGDGVLGFEMPAERSVDIDTFLDFTIAEALLRDARPG